jgi:flagellin-like hook-associated protein FlgL
MRIPFNGYSNTLVNQLSKLNYQQVSLQRQLSSGQRVQEAYEDPASVGRALNSGSEKGRIQIQARNLSRAQLVGEFSGETLEQLKVIVDQATIDANKADGLTNSADFKARALQANQQIEQALRVVNSQISGDYLFAGANTSEQPFVAEYYETGDFVVNGSGAEVRTITNTIPAVDASTVVFTNAAGELVDSVTGEATTDPATAAASLAGTPAFAIEWAADSAGTLKEWNGSDYSADALDGGGASYGEVTVANDGTSDFVAQVEKVVVSDDLVGMVSSIRYTGTTESSQDVKFRVGEGVMLSPFSRGSVNLNYESFLVDLVDLRGAYSAEQLESDSPGISYATKAQSVEELAVNFADHQLNVLLGIVDFGSLLQGIDVTAQINESRFGELERLTSSELDIDVAETIMQLNRSQTAYEAALRSGSNVMQMSLLDYIG